MTTRGEACLPGRRMPPSPATANTAGAGIPGSAAATTASGIAHAGQDRVRDTNRFAKSPGATISVISGPPPPGQPEQPVELDHSEQPAAITSHSSPAPIRANAAPAPIAERLPVTALNAIGCEASRNGRTGIEATISSTTPSVQSPMPWRHCQCGSAWRVRLGVVVRR